MASSSAQPRSRQPSSLAPAGHHVRRKQQPRPRSVHLETLREAEDDSRVDEFGIGGGQQDTRPTTMSGSYNASSYPSRTATAPVHSPYARPLNRRHTSHPHRSSPLAGPSVALTHDGTLTNVTVLPRPRSILSVCESTYTSPSPSVNPSFENLNLTIDVSNTHMKENSPPTPPPPAKQTPSRRLSLGLKKLTTLPSLPKKINAAVSSTPEQLPKAKGKAKTQHTTPTTTTAAEEAAAPMPHLPHVPVWAGPGFTSTRTGSRAPMPYRPHSPTLNQNQHLHPDSALLNRRASFTPSVRSNRSSASSHRRSLAVSSTAAELFTALSGDGIGGGGVAERPQLVRRPSTSRAPELNWLSTTPAPKFSRLGLKEEGVVLPVSAKEMRRRSMSGVSLAGSVRSVESVRSAMTVSGAEEGWRGSKNRMAMETHHTETLRKLEGRKPATVQSPSLTPSTPTAPPNVLLQASSLLKSVRADMEDSDPVSPPYPPFFAHSSKNPSASSISSSTADSDVPDIAETPSLSRTSSVTESEEDILKTPPGTIAGVGSVGVVSEGTKDLHIRSVQPVVKNSNGVVAGGGGGSVGAASGVMVEVVETRGHRKEGSESGKSVVEVGGGEGVNAKMGRKGTLKRAFGRVFGGRSGSVSGLKV
ncbi:hypothetical protein BC835DRAFT_1308417 [Cytidiella melzeri]|nr:hypothetical protein BC835DRAFT_1308417 [Cytidiella melzeri]